MKDILMDTLILDKEEYFETRRRGFYTPIADNYNNLTKEQLRDIIKELDYFTSKFTAKEEYNSIIKEAAYTLLEQELTEY